MCCLKKHFKSNKCSKGSNYVSIRYATWRRCTLWKFFLLHFWVFNKINYKNLKSQQTFKLQIIQIWRINYFYLITKILVKFCKIQMYLTNICFTYLLRKKIIWKWRQYKINKDFFPMIKPFWKIILIWLLKINKLKWYRLWKIILPNNQ